MCAGWLRHLERRHRETVPEPMFDRVVTNRHKNWIGGLASAAALSALVGTAAIASAQTTLPLQAVGWQNETLPGAVCQASGPIRLHDHIAQVSHTGFGDVDSFGSNPDLVRVAAAYDVTYGRLGGVGPAAAVDVVCSNNGGTADGQIRFADVIFGGSATSVRPVGLITPRQGHSSNVSHVPLLGKSSGSTAGSSSPSTGTGQTTRPAAPPGAQPPPGPTTPASSQLSAPWSRNARPADRRPGQCCAAASAKAQRWRLHVPAGCGLGGALMRLDCG
jgi:hypothetical protein